MIVVKLIEMFSSLVVKALSSVGAIPSIPPDLLEIMTSIGVYLRSGVALLTMFIGPSAVKIMAVALDIIVIANAFYAAYSGVMWVLKKIPFIGVE